MKRVLGKILSSAAIISALTLSAAATTFTDVQPQDWYYTYITEMAETGLLSGLGDGTYGPDQPLSIAQFTAMIANAYLGETLSTVVKAETTFWWESYLVTSFSRNTLAGTEVESHFGGAQVTQAQWDQYVATDMSRYDVAVVIYNLLVENGMENLSVAQLTEIISSFKENIPANYSVAVATAYHYGFLEGRGDVFDGEAGLSRAEAAVVLNGLLKSPMVEEELLSDHLVEPEPEPELEPELDLDPEPELEPDLEPELDLDPDLEPDLEPELDLDPELEPDVVPEPELEPEPEIPSPPKVGTLPTLPISTTPTTSYTQAELGSWVDYTIKGSSAPSAYVYNSNNGIYVKNQSGLTVTSADLERTSDLKLDVNSDEPQILIYHTHGTEAYTRTPYTYYSGTSWRSEDASVNIVSVGAVMAEMFRAAGFNVIHDTTQYDAGGNYNNSYTLSKAGLVKTLEENPSIQLVFDIHRDALSASSGTPYQLIANVGGQTMSQIMLFLGTDADAYHPNWRDNFALAKTIQLGLMEYGDFARPIQLAKTRYNQAEHTGAILLEVGGHGNTLPQAMHAAQLFAYSTSKTLTGKTGMELFGFTMYE